MTNLMSGSVWYMMMIRDKNNIFERVENIHADLAWNYPGEPWSDGGVCGVVMTNVKWPRVGTVGR